uniref:Uncharacterized protein n=1 Tax=Zea mays TaxID=4577 RepID=A0A804NSD3_MAIZE
MQRRADGPPVALERARTPAPPQAPGRPARRREGRARSGSPAAAPAALAHGKVATARGSQAGGDLHGGARGPAGSHRRVVVHLSAVDRPGAVLRHAVRVLHKAVLVRRRRRRPPCMDRFQAAPACSR